MRKPHAPYDVPMGTLYYADQAIEMDDRTLAHLKVAVVTKLRRGESFTLSWTHAESEPRGRTTISRRSSGSSAPRRRQQTREQLS